MRQSSENVSDSVPKLTPRSPGAASVWADVRVVLALAATLFVYWPVVHCFFHQDDFVHLYRGIHQPWMDLATRQWGGHMIAVFSILTAMLFKIFGPSAEAFYFWILASHLVAVLLLYILVRRLTENARAAAIVALLWGTTPAHTETLAWYSVYGQLLATIAMLLALLVIVASPGSRPRKGVPLVMAVLLLAGALSFGVGIAVALVFPLALWLLLSPGPMRRRALAAAVIVVAAVLQTYNATVGQGGLQTMGQAFLPVIRKLTLIMAGDVMQLLAYGVTRLHAGPFAGAATLPVALLAATSACWALLIAAALIRMSGENRRRMIAFAVITLAIYATIALGRSIVLAIFGVGDMGSVRRYHYAATVPLAVLSGLALNAVVPRSRAVVLDILFAVILASAIAGAAATTRDVVQYADVRAETARVLAAIEEAAAAAPPGVVVRIRNQRFAPVGGMFPGWAAIFALWSTTNQIDGRRVVFEETDAAKVAAAARGRRSAGLIVSPPGGADPDKKGKETYF